MANKNEVRRIDIALSVGPLAGVAGIIFLTEDFKLLERFRIDSKHWDELEQAVRDVISKSEKDQHDELERRHREWLESPERNNP